jgi:hypothetical protein
MFKELKVAHIEHIHGILTKELWIRANKEEAV